MSACATTTNNGGMEWDLSVSRSIIEQWGLWAKFRAQDHRFL
jgi:hypothetical protein